MSGTSVTVTAAAQDNVSVAGVQFSLDGVSLAGEDTVYPYSVVWDTTTVPNGVHILRAVARDTAGNRGTSEISVAVNNSAPTMTYTVPANGTVSIVTIESTSK